MKELCMNGLVKFERVNEKSVPATTSKMIAKVFGKNHFDVIRGIEIEINKGLFNRSKITAVTEKDAKGEERKMYILDENLANVIEQNRLQKLVLNLADSQTEIPEEFNETFKENFWDILA
jgi:phage regulator Rha-like protein